MAPWSPSIVRRFPTVPANPRENDFYAPYSKLLCTLFPANTDYTVAPRSYNSHQPIDFVFEVLLEDKPIFVLGIREPRTIGFPSAREDADSQIRRHLGDLAPSCPIPTLLAVSAFGTRISFYTFDKHTRILPTRVSADPEMETDVVPLSLWDCELLEDGLNVSMFSLTRSRLSVAKFVEDQLLYGERKMVVWQARCIRDTGQ